MYTCESRRLHSIIHSWTWVIIIFILQCVTSLSWPLNLWLRHINCQCSLLPFPTLNRQVRHFLSLLSFSLFDFLGLWCFRIVPISQFDHPIQGCFLISDSEGLFRFFFLFIFFLTLGLVFVDCDLRFALDVNFVSNFGNWC